MENWPVISVIVPVYNSAFVLERSLNSLIAQSYINLEIILVDDGSQDGSGKMCDEYAGKDSRIRVIHKLNGGVSSARNVGLKLATGEYIGFMDPDDVAESSLYHTLYQCAKDNNAEMSICGHYVYVGEELTETRSIPSDSGILCREKALKHLITVASYEGFLWNKLFARKLINRADNGYGLYFEEKIHMCEDVLFVCKCLLAANGIAYISEPLYRYMIHDYGLSHSFNLDKRSTEMDSWKLIADLVPEKLSSIAMERYYTVTFNLIRIAVMVGTKKDVAQLKKNTQPHLREYMLCKNIALRQKMRAFFIFYFPYMSDWIWKRAKKMFHLRWR